MSCLGFALILIAKNFFLRVSKKALSFVYLFIGFSRLILLMKYMLGFVLLNPVLSTAHRSANSGQVAFRNNCHIHKGILFCILHNAEYVGTSNPSIFKSFATLLKESLHACFTNRANMWA